MSTPSTNDRVTVGRITSVYGIKGWVKVHSHTEPMENVLSYQPWYVKTAHGLKIIEIAEGKKHGKGLVAKIPGIDTPEAAQLYCQSDFQIEAALFPDLKKDDYYWHQLEGLRVISEFEGGSVDLGLVKSLLETGANDVLVVKGDQQSTDQKERLIPYVPEQFVKSIDLETAEIRVDWDPDF